jgi:uncharacterized protein
MMRNKLFFFTLLILLAGLLSACGSVAYAGNAGAPAAQSDQPPLRTLSVNGTGRIYLVPDIAYVSIGVHTEGSNASEVVAANNQQSEKVKNSLKAAGIDIKDIQTTNFSIYPQPKYDDKGQATGEVTYVVDNTVYVTVRDISKVGAILDAAVKAGANSIYGIQFDVADKSEALSQARAEAVKDAQRTADELATAAGVTLGAVQTISSYSSVPQPIYDGRGGGMAVAEAVNIPVSPGQMVLTVDVSMIYEIR